MSSKLKYLGPIVIGLGLLFTKDSKTPNKPSSLEATISTTLVTEKSSKEIEYVQIGEPRYRKDSGFRTVSLNFEVEKSFWENLESRLTKKQFYDKIKKAPFRSVTNTIFNGVFLIHSHPISHEDIIEDSMNSADRYIANTSNGNFYDLDPDIRFTEFDKEVLKKLLEDNIKSPIQEPIRTIENPLQRQAYIFPPKTQIIFEKAKGNPKITLMVNINRNPEENPSYARPQIYEIDDKEKSNIFEKMLRLALLTEDPKAEDIGLIPIERLYKVYQERNAPSKAFP